MEMRIKSLHLKDCKNLVVKRVLNISLDFSL